MPGPDRKTPIDGVPVAPESIDSAEPRSPTPTAPVSPSPSAPVSPTPSAPVSVQGESDTPQAASISRSAVDPEKEAGRSRSRFWARAASYVAGARKAIAVAGGALAVVGAIFLPRLFGDRNAPPPPVVNAASLAGSVSGLGAIADGGTAVASLRLGDGGSVGDTTTADGGPVAPPVWRVSQFADDPSVTIADVPISRRALLAALAEVHVTHGEAQRVVASLGDVHSVDRFAPKDSLVVAFDKSTGRVVAYEFATSPADVWQARDDSSSGGSGKLLPKKLKLEIVRVRVRKAVLVGADLHASFIEAGLAPIDDLLPMLDDALDGHAELSDIRPGSRLRIVATQDQVDGAWLRWISLEAVEYFPATPNAPSVRVYRFGDDDETGAGGKRSGEGKRRRGWYDAKGRQPFHGGWRSPVPLARITSRYNPNRMHPVLHVVMPHTGVDFAAPVGTPVYATAAGVVTSVGNGGPCGNKVEISHAGNITSIYCHLSHFVSGLKAGMHVEQRQLIAYVGQTGRVTGPHLHFGIRRAGVMIDPMTLRLDGMRVVPRGQRDEFDRQRGELDAELDGIALPASTGVSSDVNEPADNFYEEP